MDVLSKASNDVSLRRVFADKVLGRPKAGIEDPVASLNSASNLSGSFPNDLGKVGWLGIVGVVFRNFISPRLDGRSNIVVATCSRSKVFSKCTKRASGMLELATIRPLLSFSSKVIVPG